MVGALIPGAVTMSARGSIRALLGVITKSTILRIHYYVVYKMEVRDTIRLALAETLVRFASVMMYAVEAAMIPLDYYADAQLMGLGACVSFLISPGLHGPLAGQVRFITLFGNQ